MLASSASCALVRRSRGVELNSASTSCGARFGFSGGLGSSTLGAGTGALGPLATGDGAGVSFFLPLISSPKVGTFSQPESSVRTTITTTNPVDDARNRLFDGGAD